LGKRGPDFKKLVYAPQGYGIPTSKAIDYPDVDEATKNVARARYTKNTGQQLYQWGSGFGMPQTFYQLQNNEYIVYNTDQIKMRYIVELEE
jgi:hypothetical protein